MPAAWYNTWPSHFKEVECFQQQVEPILYQYGVDMVYTGHTHAYEVGTPSCACTSSNCCHTRAYEVGTTSCIRRSSTCCRLVGSAVEKLGGPYAEEVL